jgi:choice-of-anchor B domain-containing protein
VSYNTELFGRIDPDEGNGRYSGLWGYTAPDGREYTLLGGYTGTHIIDITDAPLVEVGFHPGPHSGWREMTVYDHYGYVVSEGGGGLQIIDLAGLPDSTRLIKADTSVFRTGHTIRQEGDWIYVHGSNVQAGANQGTLIFDVATDPENPVLVGQYDRDYVHDAAVRNDTMYAAMINDGRLDIVYLGKDRTNPTLVQEIVYPGAGTHNADLSIDGRYVFTTDEVGQTDKTLKVWDLSDLDDIVKVADYTSDSECIVHNVRVKGTIAIVSWYLAGTRVLDISDPTNPVEIGFYDPFPGSALNYDGNWAVYPYYPSGKIASSDMGGGMYVFTFEGAKQGVASVTVRDSVTGSPLAGVTVTLPDLNRTFVSDTDGKINVLAAEGTVSFEAVLLNYRQKTGSFQLQSDGNNVDILMSPLALRNVTIQAVDSGTGAIIDNGQVAYLVETRGEGHFKSADPGILSLPSDSGYIVHVGAWGWIPKTISIPRDFEGVREVPLSRGYFDDAELDFGWTLGEPDDDGVGGEWERGVPVGVSFRLPNTPLVFVEPNEDHSPDPGTKAFLTRIIRPGETSPGLADVDSGRVTLTSPAFDLSTYAEPWIHFAIWYSNDAIDLFPADDNLYIRMSNDGGATWEDVITLDTGTRDWRTYSLKVDELIEPSDNMRFRIVAADSNQQGWVEAGLDDFAIADSGSPANSVHDAVGPGDGIRIWPNHVSGDDPINIDLPPGATGVLEIVSSDGRAVLAYRLGEPGRQPTVRRVSVGSLAAGDYLVRFTSRDGLAQVARLIVY